MRTLFKKRLFPRRLRPIWLVALAVVPAGIAPAQQVAVEAALMNNRIALGEKGTLVIRVSNGRPENLGDSIPADGLSIAYIGSQNNVEINNGAMNTEQTFFFQVSGENEGEFTIPALNLAVNGQTLQTRELTVTIYKRAPGDVTIDASKPYFVKLDVPEEEIYAGQMIPLELTVFVRGQRAINEVGPPTLDHEAIVVKRFRSITFDAQELDGYVFSIAKLPASIFALKEGEHTLGPAEVDVRMIEMGAFRAIPGFHQSSRVRKLESNAITVRVKPLPEAGKPPTFRGAVGAFELTAKATPLDLKTGDPITVEFTVSGAGNFELLEAPVFLPADASQWRTYEAQKIVDPAEVSDGVSEGKASFSQIIMPQSEATEIPPFELAFFNPKTGAYETRHTDPVPIRVMKDPAAATAAFAAIPSGGEAPGGNGAVFSAAGKPVAKFDDILLVRNDEPNWRGPVAVAFTSRPGFWVAQILPSIALFTLIGYGMARRISGRDRGARRRRGGGLKEAMEEAEEAETQSDFYHSVQAAIDAWGLEHPDGRRRLDAERLQALQDLEARCQSFLYGASIPDAERRRRVDSAEQNQALKLLATLARAVR
ncbi:MAG: BatD family protein [Verrucomicrobiae bacterium]|nr:BatD family protein [Verrucomicrobiae bacterium]